MRRDMVLIDTAADERSQNRRGVLAGEEIKPSVFQIADAGREPEPEQGAEHMRRSLAVAAFTRLIAESESQRK